MDSRKPVQQSRSEKVNKAPPQLIQPLLMTEEGNSFTPLMSIASNGQVTPPRTPFFPPFFQNSFEAEQRPVPNFAPAEVQANTLFPKPSNFGKKISDNSNMKRISSSTSNFFQRMGSDAFNFFGEQEHEFKELIFNPNFVQPEPENPPQKAPEPTNALDFTFATEKKVAKKKEPKKEKKAAKKAPRNPIDPLKPPKPRTRDEKIKMVIRGFRRFLISKNKAEIAKRINIYQMSQEKLKSLMNDPIFYEMLFEFSEKMKVQESRKKFFNRKRGNSAEQLESAFQDFDLVLQILK